MKSLNEWNVIEDIEQFYKMIGQNVKQYRQDMNYSQLDFSQEIGIKSVSFYCDCENGKNGKHFNLLHLVKIAKILNITIDELLQTKK